MNETILTSTTNNFVELYTDRVNLLNSKIPGKILKIFVKYSLLFRELGNCVVNNLNQFSPVGISRIVYHYSIGTYNSSLHQHRKTTTVIYQDFKT